MKRAHLIRIAPFQDRSIINDAIANKYASVGWDDIGSAENMTYEEIRDSLMDCYSFEGRQVSPSLSAIWHLKNDVKIGDYVVSPNGYEIHIGKVVQEYYFAGDYSTIEGTRHRVGVEWFTTQITRDDLSEDFRSTLRNQRTYSSLDDYLEEIRSLVEPTSFAELSSMTLTAKITLNHCTEITISGLPKNLDFDSVEALCNEIREIYRRKNAKEKPKPIRCPVCHSRIIDTNPEILSEVKVDDEFHDTEPDYVQKCWKCGSYIGIKKVS